MDNDKKYWFKLDKDKIKLQLKDIGERLQSNKINYRKVVVVFLFIILLGTGFVFYRNSFRQNDYDLYGHENENESSLLLESMFEEEEQEFSLNYGPGYLEEIEKNELAQNNNDIKIKSEEENEEIIGVVTEGVRTLPVESREIVEFISPSSGKIVNSPGWYYHSIFEDWRYLHGIRINTENGEVVMAAADGRISSTKNDEYRGIVVTIEHSNGWETEYGHLQVVNVSVGERVAQGQDIGRTGMTGITEEPLLYFALKNTEGYINPVDYIAR